MWNPREPGGFWLGPAAAGGLLIVVGIMLFVFPRLLQYFVASVFVLAGVGLLGFAWRMRRQVTYRRIDQTGPNDQDRA